MLRFSPFHALSLLLAPFLVVAGPWLPNDGLTPVDVSKVLEEGEVLDVWILAGEQDECHMHMGASRMGCATERMAGAIPWPHPCALIGAWHAASHAWAPP